MRRGGIRFERGAGTERGETAALRGQRRLAAAGGDLLQRADGPEAFGVTRRFIAGPPEAAAISDLLHGRSAGTSRPTDALAAGTGDGGDRPVVGSPAIPTASDLTRTSVRELIDGFTEPLLEGSSENCCPMVYRSALHPAVLAQRQPKGSGSPGAHNKPEFGPGAPVAATLRTDWGSPARRCPLLFESNVGFRRGVNQSSPTCLSSPRSACQTVVAILISRN